MAMRPQDMTAADKEQYPSSPSIHDLKALMDQLSSMVGTLELLRFESVLASLNYETREVRHDTIKDAHVKTFGWALDSNFPLSKWLQSGDGIFWVSGKPGSGKSTLMKFLADHTQTKTFLKQWAGGNELVVASHYFWCSGTLMQKSWHGLLRSLIFDIFRSYPLSIQQACPERWARAGAPGAASTPWTIAELANALRAMATLQPSSSLRFCFFIDGLDEYEGDHLELCEIFKGLVRAGTIKMCLSSRPWPVFEDGLGKDLSRKLYVQDLTYNDIKTYVAAQLECHPKWKTNSLTETERMDMVEAVTKKADGVFLWAYLVTRSLREGLSNHDTVTDLTRRLEHLPGDLEKLFRQMLESVNPVYQSKMACFLQAATVYNPNSVNYNYPEIPLDAGIYCNMEKELDEPGYALQCSLVQISKASKTHDTFHEWLHNDNEHVSPELRTCISKRYAQMQDIINSRTKGILEAPIMQNRPQPPIVQYFHRTMHDFIQTTEIQEFLSSKLSNNFNIHIWIMKGHLIRRKGYPVESYRSDSSFIELHSDLGDEVTHMLACAANALSVIEREDFKAVFTLLDEYERALHHLSLQAIASEPSRKNKMLLMARYAGKRPYLNLATYFREMVVLYACRSLLSEYFEAKAMETPDYRDGLPGPLLLQFTVLIFSGNLRGLRLNRYSLRPCHNMVERLLRTGANPNEPFIDQTAGFHYAEEKMITSMHRQDPKQELERILIQFKISPWVFLMRICFWLYGVPVCQCTGDMETWQFLTAFEPDFRVVGLYLNYGADPNAEFWDREPKPLLECSEKCYGTKNMSIFSVFNPSMTGVQIHTPTHYVAEFLEHPMFGKPPLWSISCFFAYIWSPFQRPLRHQYQRDYLATLDTFLSKHPSLDASSHISDVITSLELDSLGWIILNDEPSKSPFVQFCAHICYKDTWTEDSALNQFRSAIIEKLIGYCGTINADEKFFTLLEFGISKAEKCPEDIKRRLLMLDLVEENRSRNDSVS